MPGISFVFDPIEGLKGRENIVTAALTSSSCFDHFESSIIMAESTYILGCISYEHYPLMTFEHENYFICVEGKIYGKDNELIRSELAKLQQILSDAEGSSRDRVSAWLRNNDGDFVIFMLDKVRGEVVIVNDLLGRLPLYYAWQGGRLIVSREIRFISEFGKCRSVDRLAMAQILLLGFPLGERTLFEGICRLEPATVISIRLRDAKTEMLTVHTFDFDERLDRSVTLEENSEHLLGLFVDSCMKRSQSFQGYDHILGLSGGLDSRALGMCLKKWSVPFRGVTLLDSALIYEADADIAKQLAEMIGIDWHLFSLRPPTGRDMLKLIRMKQGLNYLGMGFILSFFELIRETYGERIVYFTGDGGQVLKPEMRPAVAIRDINELIAYILDKHKIFSLAEVARLAGLTESEILDDIKERLMTYPEITWNGKYTHFLIYEEDVRRNFEGEDRNRYFFPSVTPFYSIPFFEYAMKCPNNQIGQYKLYYRFLQKLSPKISDIIYADWGFPLSSKKYHLIALYRKLPERLRKYIGRYRHRGAMRAPADSEYLRCIKDQIFHQVSVEKCFAIPELQKMMLECSKYQLQNLFTVISAIEEIECSESTLEKYIDVQFL